MTTLCETLTNLIGKKLECRETLTDHIQSLLQLGHIDLGEISELPERFLLADLGRKIKQEQTKLEDLESEIYAVAQNILRLPLCLIPLRQLDEPFFQHLEMARLSLESGDTGEAYRECQLATQILLSRGDKFCSADRGLIYLFYAGISLERSDYQDAQILAGRAYGYLAPESYYPERMVARIIQGHSCVNNGPDNYIEGREAYDDTTRRLGRLQEIAAERGKPRQAELYGVLLELLQDRLFLLAESKVVEHPAQVEAEEQEDIFLFERQEGISLEKVPVIDGIAIRQEKPRQ